MEKMENGLNVRRAFKYAGEKYGDALCSFLHEPTPPQGSSFFRLSTRKGVCSERRATLSNRMEVQCLMNGVSPSKQAIIGFFCLYLLTQQDDSVYHDGLFLFDAEQNTSIMKRSPHNYPMINMLLSVVHHCYFGMVMEAKRNKEYALLVGLRNEFIYQGWKNEYLSEFITTTVETDYKPFAYILDILIDASMIICGSGILSDVEPIPFMNGIIAICALGEESFSMTDMFRKYKHGEEDAVLDFFEQFFNDLRTSIEKAWEKEGGTETNRIIIDNDGMGRSDYFNLEVCSFENDRTTIALPLSN